MFNVFMHILEYTMHFRPLVLILEGPGRWDSRGQAAFYLVALALEIGSVQLRYTYLGIYYAF